MAKFNSHLFHGTQGSPQTTIVQITTGVPVLPSKTSQLRHMFRNDVRHLSYTDETTKRIEDLLANRNCILETDTQVGRTWYAHIEPDGSKLWASVFDNKVADLG